VVSGSWDEGSARQGTCNDVTPDHVPPKEKGVQVIVCEEVDDMFIYLNGEFRHDQGLQVRVVSMQCVFSSVPLFCARASSAHLVAILMLETWRVLRRAIEPPLFAS